MLAAEDVALATMESPAILLDPVLPPDASSAGPKCSMASLRRRAWAKSRDSTWQETQKAQNNGEPLPDCTGESNGNPKKTSEEPALEGLTPNKITCWLDQCRTPLGASLEDQSAPAGKGAARNGCSFEDDLLLGDDADQLECVNKKTGSCLGADRKRSQYKEKAPSMNSTGSGKSSTVSSVSELLDLYEEDPEEILLNLGFGRDEPDMSSKIPSRFFNNSSAARGIDIKVYLGAQLQRMEVENPNYALTSRFRQIEVLTTVANQFIQLYGHVSGQPVQNVGDQGGGGEAAKERSPPSLFQRKKSALNAADRLKKSLSKHNLAAAVPTAEAAPPAAADEHVCKKDSRSLATVAEAGDKEQPASLNGEPERDPAAADGSVLEPRAPEKAAAPQLAHLRTENTGDSFGMEEIQSNEDEALLARSSRNSADLLRTVSQQSDSSGFAEETSSLDAAANLKVQESSDSCDSETTVTSHPSLDAATPISLKQLAVDLPDARAEESEPTRGAGQENGSVHREGEDHQPLLQYKAHQLPKTLAAGGEAPEPSQEKDPPPLDLPHSDPPVLKSPFSGPPTSEPPSSDPLTSEPPSSDPLTSEPPPSDPLTSEPPPSDPLTSEPPSSDPLTSEPPPFDPLTSELPPSNPPTSNPLTSEPPSSDPPPSEPPPSEPPPSEPSSDLPTREASSDPPTSDPPTLEAPPTNSPRHRPSRADPFGPQAPPPSGQPFHLPASDSPVLRALMRVKERLGDAGPHLSRSGHRGGLPLQRSSSLPSSLLSPTRVVSSVEIQLGQRGRRAFCSQPRYAFRYSQEPCADSPTCISTLVIPKLPESGEPRVPVRSPRSLRSASPPTEWPWITQSVPDLSSAQELFGHYGQGRTPVLSSSPSPRAGSPLSAPPVDQSLLYPYGSLPNLLQHSFPLGGAPHYASLWNVPLGSPPIAQHHYHTAYHSLPHSPPYPGYRQAYQQLSPWSPPAWHHGLGNGFHPGQSPHPASPYSGHVGQNRSSHPGVGDSPHLAHSHAHNPYPGVGPGPYPGHTVAHGPHPALGPGYGSHAGHILAHDLHPGLGAGYGLHPGHNLAHDPRLGPGYGLRSGSSPASGQLLSGTEMELRRVLHDIRGTVHTLNQRADASDAGPRASCRQALDELRRKRRSLAAFRAQMGELELSVVRQQALVYKHLSPADRLEAEQLESLRSSVREELLELEQRLDDKVMELTEEAGPCQDADRAAASSALGAVEPVSALLREQFILQSELSYDERASVAGGAASPRRPSTPGADPVCDPHKPAVYRASVNITPAPPPRPDRQRDRLQEDEGESSKEERSHEALGDDNDLNRLVMEIGESGLQEVRRPQMSEEPSPPGRAPGRSL
ncbi:protein ITPRID2 isoform X3 [Syngnathus acus]|uniref:protein ITPRID2 isoform X3 n=1 Tax=Syngnathus acus TaxID=161584 RepID=UPI0018864FB3|nr:protein ITPRID2 isoform X3 [Syngnathus acus]